MKVAIVHYHLEPSGVTRVIERASHELTRRGIAHVILVGKCPQDPLDKLPVRVVDGLDYDDASLDDRRAIRVLESLRAAARDALGDTPELWHFHNHSLGKNHATPRIVSMLASQNERLLLHIHDLAEDGRPENRHKLAGCPNLYPLAPQIHYAFINSRDRQHFIDSGLPASHAHLIPNPIPQIPAALHSEIRNPISEWPPRLLCMSRGIRRKNIGELILLTLLAPPGTRSAITLAPDNPQWLAIHRRWQNFCSANSLPVDFAVVDRIAPINAPEKSLEAWISHATHLVTCSISEGFGLAFIESIALGKPLVGRKLPHISHDLETHGIKHSQLYDKILIPADWIPRDTLTQHLTHSLTELWQSWQRKPPSDVVNRTTPSLHHDGMIDFGKLPEVLQERVIRKVMNHADITAQRLPLVLINGQTKPLWEWLAEAFSPSNAAPIAHLPDAFSLETHGEYLSGMYKAIINEKCAAPSALMPDLILEKFLSAEEFHFLKSPCVPRITCVDPTPFRAVILDVYGTMLDAPAGGVKSDPAADPLLREIIKSFGYQPPNAPSIALHQAVRDHHNRSTAAFPEVDLRTLWRQILQAPDFHDDLGKLVIALENAWHPSTIMPGLEHFLRDLHHSGIVLGILSNAQINTLPSLNDLKTLFAPDLTILSYQHGIAKPSPELFELLASRLSARGITPSQTLYIGNDPMHDIAPADMQGFQTALFTNSNLEASSRSDLKKNPPYFYINRWQ